MVNIGFIDVYRIDTSWSASTALGTGAGAGDPLHRHGEVTGSGAQMSQHILNVSSPGLYRTHNLTTPDIAMTHNWPTSISVDQFDFLNIVLIAQIENRYHFTRATQRVASAPRCSTTTVSTAAAAS